MVGDTPREDLSPESGPSHGKKIAESDVKVLCEESQLPVIYFLTSMEGSIPRMDAILEDILAHLAKQDAPNVHQEDRTLIEAVNTLRGDFNSLLEGSLQKRQVVVQASNPIKEDDEQKSLLEAEGLPMADNQ